MRCNILLSLLILFVNTAHAQKSNFIGDYLLGKTSGDTVTGRLFLSLDSFKIIYQVQTKDGDNYIYPLIVGTWTKGTDNNEVYFKSNTGKKTTGVLKLRTLQDDFKIIELHFGEQQFTKSPTLEQLGEHKVHH